MSAPTPPCVPECTKRRIGCHDETICPAWAVYQQELTTFHQAVKDSRSRAEELRNYNARLHAKLARRQRHD